MWNLVVNAIKSLFGGTGITQIGKDQQSASGSTTGVNSPIIAAGRDMHYIPLRLGRRKRKETQAERDAHLLAEMQDLMPDLLDSIREDLAKDPLLRDIVVLDRSTIAHTFPHEHWMFAEDTHPNVWKKIQILENHGLVRVSKPRFSYQITERLVKMLKNPRT